AYDFEKLLEFRRVLFRSGEPLSLVLAQWVIVRDLHQYDLHSVGVSDPGFDESPVFCSGLAQHGNAVLLKMLILNLNIANLHPQRKLWCGRWCFSLASNF